MTYNFTQIIVSLQDDIQTLLVRELQTVIREIECFSDDNLLWVCPPGITNPAGSLARHASGNIRHYIGHVLGGTSYIRNRESEFQNRSLTRNELIEEVQMAISEIDGILPGLSIETFDAVYPVKVGPYDLPTRAFVVHLCAHLALHVGQMGYLRRVLTGDSHSTDPVSLAPIALP